MGGTDSRDRDVSEVELKKKRLYLEEPDYQRPLVHLSKPQLKMLYEALFDIYGRWHAAEILDELIRLIEVHGAYRLPDGPSRGHEETPGSFPGSVILMLSGSMVSARGRKKKDLLSQLNQLLAGQLAGFYVWDQPTSGSDFPDGLTPNPVRLEAGVFARISCHEAWFREYLNGHPGYREFFLAFASLPHRQDGTQTGVRRGREHTRLTRFYSHAGERWVLTDRSGLQVGLNFSNPRVLLAVFDRLLQQLRRGGQWLDLGDITLHALPEEPESSHSALTAKVLELTARALQIAAPEAGLMISPGGSANIWPERVGAVRGKRLLKDHNLTPLVLWSMLSGEAYFLNSWLEKRRMMTRDVLFFNDPEGHPRLSLDSGCDVLPLQERQRLCDWVRSRGGQAVSPGRPDDLHFEWLDLFCPYGADLHLAQRLGASRSIFLALDGVSGVYPEEWLTLSGDQKTVGQVLIRMVQIRLTEPAFAPDAVMTPLTLHPHVWSLVRWVNGGQGGCLCLTNLLGSSVEVKLEPEAAGLWTGSWEELISGEALAINDQQLLHLEPFEVRWYRFRHLTGPEEKNDEI